MPVRESGRRLARYQSRLTALPPTVDVLHMPSVSEPFLAWTTSGEVDFQEREKGQPLITNRIKKSSFFLTTGGAPYDVRWRAVNPEPFEAMLDIY